MVMMLAVLGPCKALQEPRLTILDLELTNQSILEIDHTVLKLADQTSLVFLMHLIQTILMLVY